MGSELEETSGGSDVAFPFHRGDRRCLVWSYPKDSGMLSRNVKSDVSGSSLLSGELSKGRWDEGS